MHDRNDYEKLELDLDNNYYWNKKIDVRTAYNCKDKKIRDLYTWFDKEVNKINGLFYKGTALYFTYKEEKFYFTWHHFKRSLLYRTKKKLEKLGATNIQMNFGELD